MTDGDLAAGAELPSDRGHSDAKIARTSQRCLHAGGRPAPVAVQTVPLMASDPLVLEQLLESPDTVTRFLEDLTGDRIVADVVRQYPLIAGPDNALGVPAGHAITHRITVLKGSTTGVPYLYAESTFVPERLREEIWTQLEQSSDPIGRVLVAHGVGFGKEPLSQPGRVEAHAPSTDIELDSEVVLSRAYRLTIDGQPVFAIREWFLRSVLDVLDRQGRA